MSEPVEKIGVIPQSAALAEADPGSLVELMSRDPEGLKREDRDKIVRALRADRARREAVEKEALAAGKKPPSGRSPKAEQATPVPISADKLGL